MPIPLPYALAGLTCCLTHAAQPAAEAGPGAPPVPAADGPPARFPFTAPEVSRLERALAPHHANYDATEKMLRERFHSPGYHTVYKGEFVHGTRASLTYAVALLDTGRDDLRQRAEDILRRVIALQDQDPASRTYGIWSWFLEEPLSKMSPPDWNWADFCGVQLLQVALDHRQRLSPDLAPQLDAAIVHAARSVQRRNCGPGYTNIAIMGTYVTLVAAELYGLADLGEYAHRRLRTFYDYTLAQGSFTEFNSPTYSVVAVSELGRLLLHVRDAEARRLAGELYRLAWEDIAVHFHPPTRQWAGPHSRCYSTLLGRGVLALIQRATGGRVDFAAEGTGLDEQRLPLPCPAEFEPFFTRLEAPRDVVRTYLRADPPVIGTTHLAPTFALGSVNRGDLWNQRRSLLAYWGTPGAPAYLHLRCLRNGYDFAAAQFYSAQQAGRVLAAVNLATNGGNTHVSLDRLQDGTVTARELRLRFEFGGAAGRTPPPAPAGLTAPVALRAGDLRLDLVTPVAEFAGQPLRWEAGSQGGTAWLDLVLYSGPERAFRLTEIGPACVGFALRLAAADSPAPAPVAGVADGRLSLTWDELRVSIPVRPAPVGDLQRAVRF